MFRRRIIKRPRIGDLMTLVKCNKTDVCDTEKCSHHGIHEKEASCGVRYCNNRKVNVECEVA